MPQTRAESMDRKDIDNSGEQKSHFCHVTPG
jgi:hypothetical protein